MEHESLCVVLNIISLNEKETTEAKSEGVCSSWSSVVFIVKDLYIRKNICLREEVGVTV